VFEDLHMLYSACNYFPVGYFGYAPIAAASYLGEWHVFFEYGMDLIEFSSNNSTTTTRRPGPLGQHVGADRIDVYVAADGTANLYWTDAGRLFHSWY
jgi:hypothetical protein